MRKILLFHSYVSSILVYADSLRSGWPIVFSYCCIPSSRKKRCCILLFNLTSFSSATLATSQDLKKVSFSVVLFRRYTWFQRFHQVTSVHFFVFLGSCQRSLSRSMLLAERSARLLTQNIFDISGDQIVFSSTTITAVNESPADQTVYGSMAGFL